MGGLLVWLAPSLSGSLSPSLGRKTHQRKLIEIATCNVWTMEQCEGFLHQ